MRTANATSIKALFASLLVLLPLQLGAKYVGSEPWPAVFLPSFHGVPREAGEFVVSKPYITIYFEGGQRDTLEVARLLADAPYSHRTTMMRFNFDPKWLQAEELGDGGDSAAADVGVSDGVVSWLRGRLATEYPRQIPIRMEVVWMSLTYRVAGDGASITAVPEDTLNIDLR